MTCVRFITQLSDEFQHKLFYSLIFTMKKEIHGGFCVIISNKVFDFDK